MKNLQKPKKSKNQSLIRSKSTLEMTRKLSRLIKISQKRRKSARNDQEKTIKDIEEKFYHIIKKNFSLVDAVDRNVSYFLQECIFFPEFRETLNCSALPKFYQKYWKTPISSSPGTFIGSNFGFFFGMALTLGEWIWRKRTLKTRYAL